MVPLLLVNGFFLFFSVASDGYSIFGQRTSDGKIIIN